MPVVVPSQIVSFIDNAMVDFLVAPTQGIYLEPRRCGALNALLHLVDDLPAALLPREPAAYTQFVQSLESIRFNVNRAQAQDQLRSLQSGLLMVPDGDGRQGQVRIIRDALSACPDEIAPDPNSELTFIKDAAFRTALLIDLGAARSALVQSNWKAGTVMAGALVEALLLWAVQETPSADVQNAIGVCVGTNVISKQPHIDPLHWTLHEFVEISAQLNLIEPETAKEVRLAKDFRNLIHPGRAVRLRQSCDRGTALMANAAVEHTIRDLVKRFP